MFENKRRQYVDPKSELFNASSVNISKVTLCVDSTQYYVNEYFQKR